MELKEGYKQTEVGVIPEDWELTCLGSCSEITKLAGFEYTNYFNSYKDNGDIVVVRGTNITHNVLNLSDTRTIPKSTSDKLPRSKLRQGDMVFAYVGTIGPVALINEDNKYHLGPNTARITCKNGLIPRFLFCCFKGSFIKNEIVKKTSTGAQPSLSMAKIRLFQFIKPTVTEQEAIAGALSDVDALISSLETLIAKKRHIKQGAMQELLRPKKGWVVENVRNLARITTGGKNTQDRVEDGMYPFYVRSQNIKRINSYSYECEAVLTAGDGVGTGKVFHYIDGKFDAHQRVYIISNFDERLNGYYFFLFFSSNFYNRIMQMTAKSSVDSVRMEMIADMQVPLPPKLEEQEKIATILSDMDIEISALDKKLSKTRQLKQGMMAELLTGRIRLV